jgi:hypothetical protein
LDVDSDGNISMEDFKAVSSVAAMERALVVSVEIAV